MMKPVLVALALGVSTAQGRVDLVAFDGTEGAISEFYQLNDPVMGGQSTGTWTLDEDGQFGTMDGEVVDVPSLSAPGFITAYGNGAYADASSTIGGDLVLSVRSSTANYTGYRVSFAAGTTSPDYACSGGGSIPYSRGCYKANFAVPAGEDFAEVRVPFTSFSDLWDPATGDQTTTCAEDAGVCPTADKLAGIQRMQVWAEGVDGVVKLDLERIYAEAKSEIIDPAEYATCSGDVQSDLRYNLSTRTPAYGLSVPVGDDESLTEAVCCDSRMEAYAEPLYTYAAPDINMFAHVAEFADADGVTTFYDSVCGLPLFRAPVNRTLEEFEADTQEHGWPSFRAAEIVDDNVVVDEATGYVTSACGTHIGSYLPDDEGARWCIDVACVAGNPLA